MAVVGEGDGSTGDVQDGPLSASIPMQIANPRMMPSSSSGVRWRFRSQPSNARTETQKSHRRLARDTRSVRTSRLLAPDGGYKFSLSSLLPRKSACHRCHTDFHQCAAADSLLFRFLGLDAFASSRCRSEDHGQTAVQVRPSRLTPLSGERILNFIVVAIGRHSSMAMPHLVEHASSESLSEHRNEAPVIPGRLVVGRSGHETARDGLRPLEATRHQ